MSKELVKYSELLVIYKSLFTSKQRIYLNNYFINDLSFNEVAKKYHVTSMAVQDIINRGNKKLINYENKLHLYSKHKSRSTLYERINDNKLKKQLINLDK
jgi:predicted DNA-binding protein YlxM (UPF0122 family)